jgi:hypothetical protein
MLQRTIGADGLNCPADGNQPEDPMPCNTNDL